MDFLKIFYKISKENKRAFVLIFIVCLITCTLTFSIPLILGLYISNLFTNANHTLVVNYSLLLLSIILLLFIFDFIGIRLITIAQSNLLFNARKHFIDNISHLDYKLLETKYNNVFIQTQFKEIDKLAIFVSPTGFHFMCALLMTVFIIIYLLFIKVSLALILIVLIPCYYYLTKFSLEINKQKLNCDQKINLDTQAQLNNYLNNINFYKMNFLLNKQNNSFINELANNKQKQQQVNNHLNLTTASLYLITLLILLLFLVLASFSILNATITNSQLIAIIGYVALIFTTITYLPRFEIQLKPAVAIYYILKEISKLPNNQIDQQKKVKIQTISSLTIRDVNYQNRLKPRININVRTGDYHLLTNTDDNQTLFKLLTKIYTKDNGYIRVNNIDIELINNHSLWNKIYYSSQTPNILASTIFDNIVLGKNITQEQLKRICKQQGVSDLISNLNLDKQIDEQLINLSPGEESKIELLRLLLSDAELYLIDTFNISENFQQQLLAEQIIESKKESSIIIRISEDSI